MTKEESQAIWNAVQPWYQFLRKAPLGAEWHETCKAHLQQFLQQVKTLEDKPEPAKEVPPPTKPSLKAGKPPKPGSRTNGKQETPKP